MTSSANDSLLILLVVLSTVLGAVLYVWTALALAGLFRKTGEEPWQGWVPVLNVAAVLRLGGFSPWLVLVGLVPVLGWIALYVLVVVAAHRVGRDFGAGPGMTVLAALLFVVWASILGLGPARWRGRRPVVDPPPWSFAPPMSGTDAAASEAPTDTVVAGPRRSEPVAPPTVASPILSPHHFQPEPLPGAEDDSSADTVGAPAPVSADVDAGVGVVDDAGADADADADAGTARVDGPAELRPSPWAPPLRNEPPADAPAVTATPAPAPASSPAASEPAAQADPEPDPADAASAPPLLRTPVDARAAEPAPVSPEVAADAEDDDDSDDARWPSEIDEVSALSPSPFPSRAASDRPGVVPSFADPESAGSPHAGRRTWDAVPANPAVRRAFAGTPEEFPELSGEVSAVTGAPAAGAPRTAAGSVPAQLRRAEAEDDGDVDHTVVVARRRVYWQLVLPDGAVAPLTGDVVIVGRQPAPDPAFPRAQLVPVEDRTRTVSKTHARLELRSGLWHITDLHSTNGVVLTNFLGTEIELEPGSDAPAGERFLLGDAEVRIERPGA
ncbi:MAG: DUF5684 domain-containing protein [Microbacterium arborescens]